MEEELTKTQVSLNNKDKLIQYYKKNKIFIYLLIFILAISIASFSFYLEIKEKKIIRLSEDYIEAKIYIDNNQSNKAKQLLKKIIFSNDRTYSTLSLFLILNHNLVNDKKEISILFDHILKNNKFENEIKNLIIFKKALFQSDFVNEFELLEVTKPLMNTETLWKPHVLLLLGDYFVSKNEYQKAKEFYTQVLFLKNLHRELYEQARSQLALISNE